MADLVPMTPAGGSLLAPLRNPAGGSALARLGAFAAQPPVRKALPWFAGIAGMGLLALTWATLAPAPQRVLYSSLDDSERADVAAALDKASIDYRIDNDTGALTVGQNELYKARMVVASDGALAAPESGEQLLDSLPMGASRTLEGDRLRAAQERDLMLTIKEIDGVEAVRVHLARPERSVFVRDEVPPTASVMVRMARGRQLSESQVTAIANLVAGSVPGLAADSVRIVDQHGRLLSQPRGADSDRLELQSRMEAKLRTQVEQLLAPMIGADNFSSEIQVELDMNEVTSARESYDKDGAVQRETTQTSQTTASPAVGVPGVLSNTPPPTAQARPGAPAAGPAQAAPQGSGESSSSRTYAVGREVAVSNVTPGSVKRLSVAVALNQSALKNAKAADIKKFEELITAAVGADPNRGDTVAVVVRPFQPTEIDAPAFWETGWFATIVRSAVALIAVLLVLLLAVRPIVKALTGRKDESEGDAAGDAPARERRALMPGSGVTVEMPDRERLSAQIEMAQRIVREQPDDALQALRRMLSDARETKGVAR
jgi:flagellar M-ring protein FliF